MKRFFSSRIPALELSVLSALLILFQNCSAFKTAGDSSLPQGLNAEVSASLSGDPNIIYRQPHDFDLVRAMIAPGQAKPDGKPGCPQNELCVQLGQPVAPGGNVYTPLPWNAGDFTGFYPQNKLASQIGLHADWYGSAAFQAENGVIGLLLHSESLKYSGQSLFPLAAPLYYSGDQAPRPFAHGKTLVYSLEMQVPTAHAEEPQTYAYATINYRFRDEVSGSEFWYGVPIYDHRKSQGAETILIDGWEGGSQDAIIGTTLGINGKYATAFAGTHPFQPEPWKGFKTFGFKITPQNLLNAIADMAAQHPKIYSGLSRDPATYRLISFNVNPELVQHGEGTAHMGLSFRNLTISLEGGVNVTPSGPGFTTIYRLFHPNGDHLYSANPTEGTGAFHFEGAVFALASEGGAGRAPLYRCHQEGYHFLSRDAGCEGKGVDGILGYVSGAPEAGMLPLIRSAKGVQHLASTSDQEGPAAGYTNEGVIGYVWPPGFVAPTLQAPSFVPREAVVASLYRHLLGREPDAAGLQAWSHSSSCAELSVGIALSVEALSRASADNSTYVLQLYRGFLDREPEEAGHSAWTSGLNTGALSREQVVRGFAQSAEFSARCR